MGKLLTFRCSTKHNSENSIQKDITRYFRHGVKFNDFTSFHWKYVTEFVFIWLSWYEKTKKTDSCGVCIFFHFHAFIHLWNNHGAPHILLDTTLGARGNEMISLPSGNLKSNLGLGKSMWVEGGEESKLTDKILSGMDVLSSVWQWVSRIDWKILNL